VQVPRVTVFEAAEPGAPEVAGQPPPRALAPASIGDGSLRAPNGDVYRAID